MGGTVRTNEGGWRKIEVCMLDKRNRNVWKLVGLCLGFCLWLCACEKEGQVLSLGEQEYFLGERTASVSADVDSAFWIGGESGTLWRFYKDEFTKYDIGSERIYKVWRRGNSSRCLIGVRNSGLQEWHLGDKGQEWVRTYGLAHKGSHYSVYDICAFEGQVYVGTSQGLYCLSGDSLQAVYPQKESAMPFVVRELVETEDALWGAMDEGLLRMGKEVEVCLKGEKVKSCREFDHQLYCLVGTDLVVLGSDGQELRRVALPFVANQYYRVGQLSYFIGDKYVWLTEEGQEYVKIALRRVVSSSLPNVVAEDSVRGFLLLATDYALWRLPFHFDVLGGKEKVTCACVYEGAQYYATSSGLLFKREGKGEARVVYDFGREMNVRWMGLRRGYLYYVDHVNEVKRLRLRNSIYKNSVLSSPELFYRSVAKITAAAMWQGDLFVGVQDELLRFAEGEDCDTVKGMSGKYVTAFGTGNKEELYVSTLNDGLLSVRQGRVEQIEEACGAHSVRSFVIAPNYPHQLVAVAGNRLLVNHEEQQEGVKGAQKVVGVNDSVYYVLPQSGVRKYVLRGNELCYEGTYYNDIDFHPNASFADGGRLYIGSGLGMMSFAPDEENEAEWVAFDTWLPDAHMWLLGMAFGGGLLGMWGGLVLRARRRRKQSRKRKLQRLEAMFAEAQMMYGVVAQPLQQEIERVEGRLEALGEPSNGEDVSEVLGEVVKVCNRISVQLSEVLKQQMVDLGQCHYVGAEDYVAMSRALLGEGSSEKKGAQVKKNRAFLEQNAALRAEVFALKRWISKCVYPLAKPLYHDVFALSQNMEVERVENLEVEVERMRKRLEQLNGEQAVADRQAFVEKMLGRMEQEEEQDVVCAQLCEELKKWSGAEVSNVEAMEGLAPLYEDYKQVCTLKELKREMVGYAEKVKQVMAANSKLAKRKMGAELEAEVVKETKEVSKRICGALEDLLIEMEQKEPQVFVEMLHFKSPDNQQCRVMGLLMADVKVKRTLIAGMLGQYGNMNSVVSRLVKGRIVPHMEELVAYCEEHPTSVVNYMLRLGM